MKTPSGLFSLAVLLYSVILAILCPQLRKGGKKLLPALLCLLPLIAALIHFFIYGPQAFWKFFYLYVEVLLPLINLLPGKKKVPVALKSVLSSIMALVVCFLFLFDFLGTPVIHNYTRMSYTQSFKKMLDTMKKEYCLSSWKKIDYDGLLKEYLPRVEEAEKNNDESAYAAVITEVTYIFYDSHVFAVLGDETNEEVMKRLTGNDYGLSLMKLDDGKVIATFVEGEKGLLYDEPHDITKLGIHDGTQIIAWDGKEINEAIAETECINTMIQFPVKSNEDMFRPAFLAGRGGETVDITFIDDSGSEKHATLNKIGDYSSRLSGAIMLLLQPRNYEPNFSSRMLNDKCGYLLIRAEHFSTLTDNLAVIKDGSYPELTEFYASKIEELKAQGMKYLVIDIRNNVGGYDNVAGALASLFTSEKKHMFAFGFEDAQGYHKRDDQYIYPDGRYKDLPVVVLVNSQCVSAGDGMAKFLSDCDNVTLMGITASGGVNQNNGACIYLTNNISVYYPAFLTLSYEGVPLIDTDNTRQTRVPLDEKILMTKEFALRFFDPEKLRNPEAGDPQLDYAVDYMAKKTASGN
jgi:hypothetical protein